MSSLEIKCERCGKESTGLIMSFFNEEMICLSCSKKEREHPEFEKARDADELAIKEGNMNFKGIGKPNNL